MHVRTTRTRLLLLLSLAFAACGTDPSSHATSHGDAARPLVGVAAVEAPSGGRELLLLPMRSRAMSADWALEHGTRVKPSDLEAALDALPEDTRLIPLPAGAFDGSEGLIFDLDRAEADAVERLNASSERANDVARIVRGLAAPFDWGSGRTSKGNCYRYAVNDPMKPGEPHSPFPGGTDPGRRITCDDIIGGAIADGAVPTNADGTCPTGRYKICAAIQDMSTPGPNNDYHWWRQEPGGGWTNKPGYGPVAPSGDPSDPANRGSYDRFCGCVCVPLGPVYLDLDAVKAPVDPVEPVEPVDPVEPGDPDDGAADGDG